MQALSTAESGKRYTIKWMFGNKNVLDFLHQYDFKEGSIIDVIGKTKTGHERQYLSCPVCFFYRVPFHFPSELT